MELQDLKKIGLTTGEINVYEALIDLGETTRTELAKKSGVSPSKIYDVANRLIEKGIISSVKKNGIIHFSALNPEKIKDYIEQKEKDIEKEKILIDSMLPMLLTRYQKTDEKTDVEVFYGWEGMKTAFNDIIKSLNKGEFNYVFGAGKGIDDKQSDRFFSQYYMKKKEKGFGTKIIFNEELRGNNYRTQIFKEKPNQLRFLNHETVSEINIYKNKTLIILLLKKPIIIRIKNQEAADSYKQFFDTLWSQAKE